MRHCICKSFGIAGVPGAWHNVARICLLTPGQPSTNPRLLKEADALVEAGHDVEVICAHWAAWADETDRALLRSRRFKCTYVGGHSEGDRLTYSWTRVRHKVGRMLAPRLASEMINRWALCRVTPELMKAAQAAKADLYIAHNLGALPAAVAAARKNRAKAGFDAEDFHSGIVPVETAPSFEKGLIEKIERQHLAACDYVTTASPLIAKAYQAKYSIAEPTTILNVFPLAHRPSEFRPATAAEPLTLYWFSQTIGRNRGLEDVLRAWERLKTCDIELHLCGQWQQGYEREFFNLAQSCGLDMSRLRHHQPINPDQMIAFGSQFDIGLATEPGRDENNRIAASNKLFTYLLAGNAVAATLTAGQRLFVEATAPVMRGYQPGDSDALAEIIKHWYEHRKDLENVRRQAWTWGESRYNWDIEKLHFLNFVVHVLESSRNDLTRTPIKPAVVKNRAAFN
jgi:glycosyltransferase involved in cell wall biosynthesis